MRSVSIPAVYGAENYDRNKLLSILKRTGAKRVMLAIYRVLKGGRIQPEGNTEGLAEEIVFFEREGFEVCVWIGETVGHGWPVNEKSAYRNVVNIRGNTGYAAFCPTDETFVADVCAWIKNVAAAGAKQILLDDDFRMSNHGAAGGSACCLCDAHVKLFCERVGERLTRAEIAEKVFSGGPSAYRDAWLAVMRETMLSFAKKIRAAVNEVDETIRIGLCGAPSMLDLDGACNEEVLDALSGSNGRLWRPCAAPYWAHDGFELARVILIQRLSARLFCRRDNTEVIAEGDTYPRPRLACPATYLEIYDQALAADGGGDGILKYMIEYAAPYDYETGFIDRHVKNAPLLRAIAETFRGGECVGLRLFEHAKCFRGADFGDTDPYENADITAWRQGIGVRFAAGVCAPVAFGGDYPVIAFGENAKYIAEDMLKNGAILDVRAAKFLQERGVDTGLIAAEKAEDVIGTEYFIAENAHVTAANPVYENLTIKPEAEPLTFLEGKGKHIGAYRYKNEKGMRFLVYSADCERTDRSLYRCYARQREIVRETEWLCGRKLPAACPGHPDTYLFCKRFEGALAVGFWNLFPDDIPVAEIALSRPYASIEWICGKGELCGDKVRLESVAPYAFVCFKVQL